MKIIQIVPLDRKCTLGVTPALGDAHCTGAWRTAPGAMHWYRGLYALVPEFINGAPRIRLPLIDAPPSVGAAKGTGAHRCSAHWFTAHRYSAGVYTAQCMHTGQCVQCVQCIHCTVGTVYTLYSVYVQCTLYTLYSVSPGYTLTSVYRCRTVAQCVQ